MFKYKIGTKVTMNKDAYGSGSCGDAGVIVGNYDTPGMYKVKLLDGEKENIITVKFEREFDVHLYANSNRYKLKESLYSTGFNATELSIASGYNKSYFSSAVSESRFIDRGDLSESAYNKLDTDLNFAERKLLGLDAKKVDSENNARSGWYVSSLPKFSGSQDELNKLSSDLLKSIINNTPVDKSPSKNHKITIVNNVTKDYRYAVACIIYIFTVIIGFICFMSWLAVK